MTYVDDRPDSLRDTEDRYRRRTEFDSVAWGSHCVDCYPGGCSYRVYVKDGKIVREEVAGVLPGKESVQHSTPDNFPMGCNKGAAWSAQLDAADRLLYPLRRVGERGGGEWERISWDEALDEIADAVIDTIETDGGDAVLKEGTPEIGAGVMAIDRFLNLVGGTITDLNGSINDFAPGHHLVFGKFFLWQDEADLFNSDVLVFWHTNPVYTTQSFYHFIAEARYHGCEVVLFAPDVSPSHTHADYHIPVKWASDPAMTLAMCQVVVEEGLVDEEFVRTQTDLSLLVRTDTNRFLRESDFDPDEGYPDQFFHLDPARGVVPADRGNLLCDYTPALSGETNVTLGDGTTVTVRPLMERLREHLQQYTPEQVQETCGVHPETIRTIARKIGNGRTRVLMGMGANKAYHSDLYQRTMNLLLALTGNWGRKGAGINCWATTQIDGQLVAGAKVIPGVEGAEQVLDALDAIEESVRAIDPTMTPELVAAEIGRSTAATGRQMVPPVFLWYWHAGFRERWNNPVFNDPDMVRSFDEYFDEAVARGWWGSTVRPGPDNPPRVLIECGGNILRRTRGGRAIVLDNLWPKLNKIVTIDIRMSTTALHSDIVLPAAQHYEKVGMDIPIMAVTMSDAAVPPAGEAKPEWEIFRDLCLAMERRAAARGLETYQHRDGTTRRYDELWSKFTLDGAFETQERMADEIIRDAAYAGVLPPGTSLETVREKGSVRFTGWGRLFMARGQAAPWPEEGEPYSALMYHVERGDPYPTLTRRAQFLIEHPWFVEAGEDLPVHKDAPAMGGNHPFRMTTGHNRWSVHAMNTANPHLIQTHRGEPHAVINTSDAARLGIADHAKVRISNDVGEFTVRAKLSGSQRPGGVTVYNGWDPHQFEGWSGPNEVEPGMVKYLGLAGGYGHLRYAPMEWQPVPTDRCIFVAMEPVPE